MKPKPKPASALPPGLLAEIMMFLWKAERSRLELSGALMSLDSLVAQARALLEKHRPKS